jgi:hypothetical protein
VDTEKKDSQGAVAEVKQTASALVKMRRLKRFDSRKRPIEKCQKLPQKNFSPVPRQL